MTRAEHLEWAKGRALAYLERGEPDNALASILSDLSKHEETAELGMYPHSRDAMWSELGGTLREWIEGLA